MPKFFYFSKKIFWRGIVVISARACYNKDMKIQKTMGIALSALLLFGGISVCAPVGLAASAQETEEVALTDENAELFLPASYEQYLPLSNPSDAAVTDRYIAVSEKKLLYLYDRERGNGYRVYEHQHPISKIQFSDAGRLYFADSLLGFYELDLTAEALSTTTESRLSSLTTFYIQGDTLFSAHLTDTGTEYTTSNLSAPDKITQFDSTDFSNPPKMTFLNGKFYSVVNRLVSVYEYNANQNKYLLTESQILHQSSSVTGLQSVCTQGGKIYYTLNNDASGASTLKNGLYEYDPNEKTSRLALEADALGALAVCGGDTYCLQGGSVRKIAVTDGRTEFTSYEIASSSPSVNRLTRAVDSARARDLLVTADVFGERSGRVSVYRFSSREYSQIPCTDENGEPFAPDLVATDGEQIAVTSGEKIYTENEDGTGFILVRTMKSNVKGLACVYGSVYFVTDYYVYGKVGEEAEAVRTRDGNLVSLTADLYGNLYAAYCNAVKTTVYRFTEDEFTNNEKAGATAAVYEKTVARLHADYEGNLYFLEGDVLCKNGKPFASLDGNGFVYRGKDAGAVSPSAFALGFEDDEVYFLFENFCIKSKSDALEIPCLDEIAAENAAEQAFAEHAPEGLSVQLPAGSVGIVVDLSELSEESAFFPYSRYYRTAETRNGVLLAQTERYSLVMLYEKDRSYTANLFRNEEIVTLEDDFTEATGFRYLTNEVSAYYIPCMHEALGGARLQRGARVSFLGTLRAEEGEYAYFSYTDGTRAEKRGYVPLSYLTEVNPYGEERKEFMLGTLGKEGETVLFSNGESSIKLLRGTQLKLYRTESGDYRAEYEHEGKIYSATVTEAMLETGKTDALRISLIVILSVLAIVIVGVYVYMLPRKRSELKK